MTGTKNILADEVTSRRPAQSRDEGRGRFSGDAAPRERMRSRETRFERGGRMTAPAIYHWLVNLYP